MKAQRSGARWLALVPVALLSMTATVQAYRVVASNLTPWKGGGYGMFSTTNSQSNRPMVVSLLEATGDTPRWVRVRLPSFDKALSEAGDRVLAEPTQRAAEELAERIAEQNWRIEAAPSTGRTAAAEPVVFTSSDPDRLATGRPFSFAAIKIQVWRLMVESKEQKMTFATKPLLTFERSAPARGPVGAAHVGR